MRILWLKAFNSLACKYLPCKYVWRIKRQTFSKIKLIEINRLVYLLKIEFHSMVLCQHRNIRGIQQHQIFTHFVCLEGKSRRKNICQWIKKELCAAQSESIGFHGISIQIYTSHINNIDIDSCQRKTKQKKTHNPPIHNLFYRWCPLALKVDAGARFPFCLSICGCLTMLAFMACVVYSIFVFDG